MATRVTNADMADSHANHYSLVHGRLAIGLVALSSNLHATLTCTSEHSLTWLARAVSA